jgi:hypothetical protein
MRAGLLRWLGPFKGQVSDAAGRIHLFEGLQCGAEHCSVFKARPPELIRATVQSDNGLDKGVHGISRGVSSLIQDLTSLREMPLRNRFESTVLAMHEFSLCRLWEIISCEPYGVNGRHTPNGKEASRLGCDHPYYYALLGQCGQ